MSDFFTSDTHYGHANIIKYCNRPFASVPEMNDVLVENINKKVGVMDTLWHLGDFAMGGHQNVREFRNRIKCRNIFLIIGNHDNRRVVSEAGLFNRVYDLFEYKNGGTHSIVLCHYAMKVWNKSHHGYYHLYGHSHGTLPDDPNSRCFDIGVDCHNFAPLSLKEIDDIINRKQWKPVDHHNPKTT